MSRPCRRCHLRSVEAWEWQVTGSLPMQSARSLSRLLAYVALEPGAHSRDELTALLWGEYPEEKAKASLRQALTHLREAVPGGPPGRAGPRCRSSPARSSAMSPRSFDWRENRLGPPRRSRSRVFSRAFIFDGARPSKIGPTACGLRSMKRMTEVLTAVTREALATRQWREAVRLCRTLGGDRAARRPHRMRRESRRCSWLAIASSPSTRSATIEQRLADGDRPCSRAGAARAGRANSGVEVEHAEAAGDRGVVRERPILRGQSRGP